MSARLPGTTRDYISAFLMLGPWRIEILDTAGLHEAGDAIEQIGINHTIEQAETADFFLLVLDAALPSPALPESLLARMTPKNTIVVENKIDLPNASDHQRLHEPSFSTRASRCRRTLALQAFRELWTALDRVCRAAAERHRRCGRQCAACQCPRRSV